MYTISYKVSIKLKHQEKKMIYLVKYKESGNIEGYVEKVKDFYSWLEKSNRKRINEGESEEFPHEFSLEEVEKLGED